MFLNYLIVLCAERITAILFIFVAAVWTIIEAIASQVIPHTISIVTSKLAGTI